MASARVPIYRIRDWDKHFEISQSRSELRRERAKPARMSWVAIPNKHDGKSYRRLMRLPDGPTIYCAWILIVQVASKCDVRGTLINDGRPLAARDLEDKTDLPARWFERAFRELAGESIGWLEVCGSAERAGETEPATTVEPTPEPEPPPCTERHEPHRTARWPRITPENLRDPAFVDRCYHAALALGAVKDGWLKQASEANRLNVHCAAASVVRRKTVRDPAKAFTAIVKKRRFGNFAAADEESARKAIRKLDRPPLAAPAATARSARTNSPKPGNRPRGGNSSSESSPQGNSPDGATAATAAAVAEATTAALAASSEIEQVAAVTVLDREKFEEVRQTAKDKLRAKMAGSGKPKRGGKQDGEEQRVG